MAKNREEIQDHIANRKLTILKGFKEVSETPPVLLKDLQAQVGKENVYTYEIVKGFTSEVLEKGNDADRLTAKETINNLMPVGVIDERGLRQTVYVEKGHMNFDSSSGGGRQGLVKKEIVDKTGKNTTRWVKQGEDVKEEKQAKPEKEVEDKEGSDEKESLINRELSTEEYAAHAAETSSEDLQAFIQKNPDGEGVAEAKAELENRGEVADWNEKQGEIDQEYSDQAYIQENKDAIVELLLEDPTLNLATAMKLHQASNKGSDSETHAAIDEAQAALDGLKERTGHPGASEEGGEGIDVVDEDGNPVESDYLQDIMETATSREDFIKKVNYGITDEQSTVSPDNDEAIGNFWDSNSGEGGDGAPEGFDDDKDNGGDATIESLGDLIFNAQGKDNSPEIFDAYMALKDSGMSDEEIESEMSRGNWDEKAMMSDEEKEGMKEEWEMALDGIFGAGERGNGQPNPKDKSKMESDEHSDTYDGLKEDAKDGNLDTTKEELGNKIDQDHKEKDADEKKDDRAKDIKPEGKKDDVNDGNDEEGNTDDANTTLDEKKNTGHEEMAMNDILSAIEEEYGLDTDAKTIHEEDVINIIQNYDIADMDGDSQTGILDSNDSDNGAKVEALLEKNGWTIERG